MLSDYQNEPGFVAFILGFVDVVGDGWRKAGGRGGDIPSDMVDPLDS